MTNFTQWRASIGPPFKATDDPCWWNWSALNYGSTYTPYTSTTLASGILSSTATTVSLVSAGGWPSAGGFWVGAGASGEAWEYISYSGRSGNTLTGCVREPLSYEQNCIHSIGAPVRFWWAIDTDDGKLHLSEELDENLATITWKAEIGGVVIPQAAIRNHHLILIEKRNSPADSLTVFLVGWLDQARVNDDAKRYGEWSAKIVSSAEMVRKQQVNGLQVGDLDMAKKGSAQGSTSLGSPFKERYSGDYIAANPSFDASMTIDDDAATLWLAERYMGDYNTPSANHDPMNPENANAEFIFTQVYCNPPAGQSGGRRWVELTATGGVDVTGYQVFSATDTSESDYFVMSPGGLGLGDHVLIVEDKAVFESENPLHNEAAIFEKPGFFSHMSPTSGELSIRIGAINQWTTNIKWGDSSRHQHDVDGGAPGFWSGSRITAPGQGETMRYVYADPGGSPTSSQYWRTSNIQSPAYDIGTSPDQWVQVQLGGMELILRDDVTGTVPGSGATLYINDASGPNTGGLANSGTLQIGSEQITYSSKTKEGVVISARGVSGTTPASHAAKDLVYVMDSGTATDAAPIKKIAWTRQGGTIYPNNFHIKYSNLPTGARTPDSGSDYATDYSDLAAVSGWGSASYSLTLSPARRIKFLLLTIARMTANPGRPRINTIEALADETYYDSDSWLTGAQTCGGIIRKLLMNANIPSGAIVISEDTAAPSKTMLSNDDGWTLVADFCDYTGIRVTCQRDSKFTITTDTADFWTNGSVITTDTWSRSTASTVEHDWSAHGNVSQISMKWQSADNTASGTVVYPADSDFLGKTLELGPLIYANNAAAQQSALRRYIMNKYPYTVHIDCADAEIDLRAGTLQLLNWQWDSSMLPTHRAFMARAVENLIEKNALSTIWEGLQVDRTAGF